ncbi:hypothetical protein Vafri_4342 [Volvox africanus]|uniref:Tim44-like domain-containing protein n=1 Tax=Volvox africanus TaxID=51714 RepID=A0A8J4ATF7_9CHLO|nr:hypothetical protein Vafri_4342 [Volvox africanus]
MSFIKRCGGRLLMRLARCVPAESAACSTSLPLQSHFMGSSSLWSFSGVRRMSGGEEPSSRPAASVSSNAAGPQPPPPGSAPSRNPDPQPGASTSPAPSPPSASSSSSRPSSPSPSPSGSRSADTESSSAVAGEPQARSDGSSMPTSKPTSKLKPKPKPEQDDDSSRDQSREGDEPENVHKYHAFWRNERVRRMQPQIEEGMRINAYEGLQGFGGFMRGPDQAWSFLYDNPSARLAAAALVPLWSAGVALVRPLVLGPTGSMIRDEVDRSFDAQEFVEAVSQAVPVFFDAVAAGDAEALSRMCTPRGIEALDRDRRRLREELGLEITRVVPKVGQATLAGGNLWGPESIRAFDPAWAGNLSPDMSRSWLVVGVYLDVSLMVSYRRVGNAGDGGGGAGSTWGGGQAQEPVELQLPVRRWGTWFMARGPLPKGPAESLDCPWKLLAWY